MLPFANLPSGDKTPRSQIADKTLGIILTVLGGAIGVWVFIRFTNFLGQMHTWSPPFDNYEKSTLAGAVIAAVLLIVGLVKLTKRST